MCNPSIGLPENSIGIFKMPAEYFGCPLGLLEFSYCGKSMPDFWDAPSELCLFSAVVNSKIETQAALWRIPSDSDPSDKDPAIQDDSSSYARSLEVLCRFDNRDMGNMIRY